MCGNSGSHWKREPEVSGVILRPIVVIGLAKMALLDLCHLSFLVELELWNMPLRSIDAGPQHNLVIFDGILEGGLHEISYEMACVIHVWLVSCANNKI